MNENRSEKLIATFLFVCFLASVLFAVTYPLAKDSVTNICSQLVKFTNVANVFYGDISNCTGIPEDTSKADKVVGATAGNLAELDVSGNLVDSGADIDDYSTTAQIASIYYNQAEQLAKFYQIDDIETYFYNIAQIDGLLSAYSTAVEIAAMYYNQTEILTMLEDYEPAITTLSHEKGGLEADVSAYDGLVKISGGTTSQVTDSSADWDTAYNTVSAMLAAAQGAIFYVTSTGTMGYLEPGTAGYALVSNGAGANPSYQEQTGGHTIKDAGTPLTQRTGLNFTGFTVADDAGNDETDVTLPTTAYTTTFDNSDLTDGWLTVNHSLGQRVVITQIMNNEFYDMGKPDDSYAPDEDTLQIKMLSWVPITGTWSLAVVKSGGSGSGGVDTTSLHKTTANEISAMTEKETLADDDVFVIEDSADGYNKKKVKYSNIGGSIVDPSAIGDMLYSSDGATWERLPKGSDNQQLVMNGNIPNWETATGGGGEWELVERKTFDAAATSYTFYVDGDTDLRYKIVASVKNAYNGAVSMDLKFNSPSSAPTLTDYKYRAGVNSGTGISVQSGNGNYFIYMNELNDVTMGDVVIFAKSGIPRLATTNSFVWKNSSSILEYMMNYTWYWTNTVDNIESITFYASQSGAIATGSYIELRKLAE